MTARKRSRKRPPQPLTPLERMCHERTLALVVRLKKAVDGMRDANGKLPYERKS